MNSVVFVIFIGIMAVGIPSNAAGQATQLERQVVYSLQPGEELLQAGSAVCIFPNKIEMKLVLSKGKEGPFFVVQEGGRLGPFASRREALAVAEEANCQRPGPGGNCAIFHPDPPETEEARIEGPDSAGVVALRFNGRSYGSYSSIEQIEVVPDKSRAYFLAVDKAGQTWFDCTDGRKVAVAGSPQDLHFSPDGRNAILLTAGTRSLAEIEKMGQLPPDKMAMAMKDAEKKFLYAIDGRKFGPFGEDLKEAWFPVSSNAFYFQTGDKVHRDGTAVAVPAGFSPCAYFPSEDGTHYALYTEEKLIFSDGPSYPFPLGVTAERVNGRIVIKWAALESNRNIVVYQRGL
jgi:hypothetical protein